MVRTTLFGVSTRQDDLSCMCIVAWLLELAGSWHEQLYDAVFWRLRLEATKCFSSMCSLCARRPSGVSVALRETAKQNTRASKRKRQHTGEARGPLAQVVGPLETKLALAEAAHSSQLRPSFKKCITLIHRERLHVERTERITVAGDNGVFNPHELRSASAALLEPSWAWARLVASTMHRTSCSGLLLDRVRPARALARRPWTWRVARITRITEGRGAKVVAAFHATNMGVNFETLASSSTAVLFRPSAGCFGSL